MKTDNLIIPVKAPHEKNAEKFINYVLEGKVSSEITTSIEYINVNTAAKEFMPKVFLITKLFMYLTKNSLKLNT